MFAKVSGLTGQLLLHVELLTCYAIKALTPVTHNNNKYVTGGTLVIRSLSNLNLTLCSPKDFLKQALAVFFQVWFSWMKNIMLFVKLHKSKLVKASVTQIKIFKRWWKNMMTKYTNINFDLKVKDITRSAYDWGVKGLGRRLSGKRFLNHMCHVSQKN